MKKAHTLYSSPNGDRWYLICGTSGEIFIRHEATLASGGHVAHIDIGTFLSTGWGRAAGITLTDRNVGGGSSRSLVMRFRSGLA
jgi:hypothetical protein